MLFTNGCVSAPPTNLDNTCVMFQEESGWYADALRSQNHWGIPVSTLMAIMYQESHFHATIKPPRRKLFYFIPWTRPTSADGYSQAVYETWWEFQDDTHNFSAQRSNFKDAIYFVGWYCRLAHDKLGIPLNNTFELYLVYHEGILGYSHRSYANQAWLIAVAHRVSAQATMYNYQLQQCSSQLSSSHW